MPQGEAVLGDVIPQHRAHGDGQNRADGDGRQDADDDAQADQDLDGKAHPARGLMRLFGQIDGRRTKEGLVDEAHRIEHAQQGVHTVSLATVSFLEEGGGTRVRYSEQMCIIPPSDGVEGRRRGWKALLGELDEYLQADTSGRPPA